MPFTEELRGKVRRMIAILQDIRERMITPKAEYGAKCKRCSLRELCMPEVRPSAEKYCKDLELEAKEAGRL